MLGCIVSNCGTQASKSVCQWLSIFFLKYSVLKLLTTIRIPHGIFLRRVSSNPHLCFPHLSNAAILSSPHHGSELPAAKTYVSPVPLSDDWLPKSALPDDTLLHQFLPLLSRKSYTHSSTTLPNNCPAFHSHTLQIVFPLLLNCV